MRGLAILNGRIGAVVAQYVSVNVLGMIGLSLYVLADTFFVANGVGSTGLVALNMTLPLFSFISGLGMLIGMGGGTHFSLAFGRGDTASYDRIFTQTVTVTLGTSLVVTALGLFFIEPLAYLLGATDSTFAMLTTYGRTLLCFAPFFMMNNVLISFVRNDMNPALAMVAMLAGSLFNIVFDYIFIYPMGMGMFGAALATGCSPIVGMCILSLHFWRKKNHMKLRRCAFDVREILRMLASGIPSFISEFSSGLVILIFNLVILSLAGELAVAAYGIIANVALVAVAIFTGIGQGIQPILSANHGAGHGKRVRKALLLGCIIALSFGALFFVCGLCFPTEIAMAFNGENNPELTRMTVEGMPVYFSAFFFMGVNIVFSLFFAAVGQPRPSFFVALSRAIVAVLPFLLILPRLLGLLGVWMTIPLSELTTCVFGLLLAWRALRQEPTT